MAFNPQQSNFNSPNAGSAWWVEVPSTGALAYGAWQGFNVFNRFKERLRWRTENTTGVFSGLTAAVRAAMSLQFSISDGAGITAGDLDYAIGWARSNESVLGADVVNEMDRIVAEAKSQNRLTPRALSFIVWFTFGAEGGTPFMTRYQNRVVGTYSIPANTVAPALGAAPPQPAAGAPSVNLRWLQADAVPAAIAPPGGSTNPDPQLIEDTLNTNQQSMNWTPWIIGGVVVGALAIAGGVYYYKKKKASSELAFGEYDYPRLMSGAEEDGDMMAMERHAGKYRRTRHYR